MQSWAQEAHRLSDYLGDDHDLAVLIETLRREELVADSATLDLLASLVQARRRELQSLARPVGERIYAEKPGAFVARVHGYWRTAREQEVYT